MEIILPWGSGQLPVEVPDSWTIVYPRPREPRSTPGAGDELTLVKTAMRKPIDAKPLASRKLKKKRVLIIVDDNTRHTPVHRFFHLVTEALRKAGVSLKDVIVMPGLGVHTPMTEREMVQKIGSKNLKQVRWENHDAFTLKANYFFGTTSRRTPVYLNKRLKDADLVIIIGLVEPHLWAGFGGGLKSILPGIAYAGTIGVHHEIIAEPPYRFNRVGMMPDDNSFRRDLEEIRGMIGADIFCINVVLGPDMRIAASFAGDPVSAHRAAVAHVYRERGLAMDRPVDGIIVNSFPLDINFKQGMKSVGNSLPALRPGGAVMGFLRAERGMDDIVAPKWGKPLWLVRGLLRMMGPARVRPFLEKVRKGLAVEEKFLMYYSLQLIRAYDLFLYVPTVTDGEARRLSFFTKCEDPDEVIRRAVRTIGRQATVAVFPESGVTFPVMEGCGDAGIPDEDRSEPTTLVFRKKKT